MLQYMYSVRMNVTEVNDFPTRLGLFCDDFFFENKKSLEVNVGTVGRS